MNKTQLIDVLAKETGLTKVKATQVLEVVLGSIVERLAKKEDVAILGFGTFTTVERAARQGRHPQTGAMMEIPASCQVKFKPGKNLKEMVQK